MNHRATSAEQPQRRSELLEGLRQRIRVLERQAHHHTGPAVVAEAGETSGWAALAESRKTVSQDAAGLWSLGIPEIDRRLGAAGLDPAGVHEVKPMVSTPGTAQAAAWASAIVFALRLAVRRLEALHALQGARPRPLLWCWPRESAGELGELFGPGLLSLGLDPAGLVIAEAPRPAEALWAIEEAVRSGAVALVLGVLDEVGLTPARRLSLAAQSSRTPCLLLSAPRSPPAAAAATRWRIGEAASAPHPFDPAAPGPPRHAVALERCRRRPVAGGPVSFLVEWSDETLGFRLASPLADGTPATRCAAGFAGG
jgi:hypothetical protein